MAKDSPKERSVIETFIEEFVTVLRRWHADILGGLRTGDIARASEAATRRTIARVLDEHRDAVTAAFDTLYQDGAEAGRAAAIRRYDLDVGPRVSDRVTRELYEYAVDASDEVGQRMTDDIATALREAWDDGLGQPEIERILSKEVFPQMESWEAERAARTEGTAAAGRGQVSSFQDAGVPGKRWLAEDDTRTRTSHREADGQVVPVGASFEVDGHAARWPGDPRLPISERANCRCGSAPVWKL
ncbi:phage minor head protein [Halorubrum sp. HHNYT27]|uniref:phage minor head protein n=1 Tax=Halorubrum sp. HHNYT27 TaxID=3402275 RepID=UPI003EB8F71F